MNGCILRLILLDLSSCLMQIYTQSSRLLGPEFVKETCERLNVKNPRSFLEISMRNLGRVNDAGIWKPEIGRHNTDVSNNANIFLHLFQKNALCIINTFFQHRHLHKMQRIIASTVID